MATQVYIKNGKTVIRKTKINRPKARSKSGFNNPPVQYNKSLKGKV